MKLSIFKFKDIFNIESSVKNLNANNLNITDNQIPNSYPYVVRQKANNGIKGYVIPFSKEDINKGNVITLSLDTMFVYYQQEPFLTGNRIKILTLKDNQELNLDLTLYLKAALNKTLDSLKWGIHVDIPNIELELPITDNDKPDYNYMEQYIKNMKTKYVINTQKKVNDELNIMSSILPFNDDIKFIVPQFKEFFLEELFDITPSKTYKNVKETLSTGDIPVISNTSFNNGIIGVTSLKANNPGQVITFSDTTDSHKTFFYQDCPFVGYSHIQTMKLKDTNIKLNNNLALYIITCILHKIKGEYNYGIKFNRKVANQTSISLPITDDGKPDYEYMEKYIKQIEAKYVERVKEEYSSKHKLYLEVTNLTNNEIEAIVNNKPLITPKFKEFKIGELFDISRGDIQKQGELKEGNTVFVAQNISNNGFVKFVSDEGYKVFDGNQIVVGRQTGVAYLQSEPFVTTDGVLVLTPKEFINNKHNVLLYFLTNLIVQLKNFNYSNPVAKGKLETLKVSLPVMVDGELDFEYMEQYIQNIEKKYVNQIKEATEQFELSFNKSNPKYKEFKIGDLFQKLSTKKLPYKTSELPSTPEGNFTLPALTAGVQNQGILNYVNPQEATILKDVITISANGANAGTPFFQSDDFTVLQDAYAIDLIDKPLKVKEEHYLFLLSILKKTLLGKYDWSNKAGWNKVRLNIINIPVMVDGRPDFEYMEKYIQNMKTKYMEQLNHGLTLLSSESKEFKKEQVMEKEYKVTELFPNVQVGKRLTKNDRIFGTMPLITAGTKNMGIANYISNAKIILPADSITISMFGKVFYRDHEYCADDNIISLYNPNLINKNVLLYINTIMSKKIQGKYSYSKPFRKTDLKDLTIKLPVDINGDLNIQYINDYIINIKKLYLHKINGQFLKMEKFLEQEITYPAAKHLFP